MIYYDIWCNLKDSRKDLEFCENVSQYLGALREKELIEDFSIKRRLLGLGPEGMGEFQVTVCLSDLSQLDAVFNVVATRAGEIESKHHAVYSTVRDLRFGLSRDFPDPVRADSD